MFRISSTNLYCNICKWLNSRGHRTYWEVNASRFSIKSALENRQIKFLRTENTKSHLFTNKADYGSLSSRNANELINSMALKWQHRTLGVHAAWYSLCEPVCVRHEENNFIRRQRGIWKATFPYHLTLSLPLRKDNAGDT
jgi:hypothetical protein